jgi:hypothetical protein
MQINHCNRIQPRKKPWKKTQRLKRRKLQGKNKNMVGISVLILIIRGTTKIMSIVEQKECSSLSDMKNLYSFCLPSEHDDFK